MTPSPLRWSRRVVSWAINSDRFVIAIWLLVGVVLPYRGYLAGRHQNYLIFKNASYRLLEQQKLYTPDPGSGLDSYLYGPLFAALMAPFAWLPDNVGIFLFSAVTACVLLAAIRSLPIERRAQNGVCLLSVVEFGNNQQHFQFNGIVAALVLLAFSNATAGREVRSALYIILGTLTKVYGVIALAFIPFTRNKRLFVAALLGWSVVALLVPMLCSTPSHVVESYPRWMHALVERNQKNFGLDGFQDKSVGGLIRRVTRNADVPQLPVLLAGTVLFGLPYVTSFRSYSCAGFRLLALSSALMFTVLFSSASENPTFIILQVGVAIWCCAGSSLPLRLRVLLMVSVVLLSAYSPTDLYPEPIREFFATYALRIIPCALVWMVIIAEMLAYAWRPVIPDGRRSDMIYDQ